MIKSPAAARVALLLSLLAIPLAYVLTLAKTAVYGDPTEYTFVANILGIAHPPGYAFFTLLGKLFQTLIPFGEIPWRMHLLAAMAATAGALFAFGTVRAVARILFTGLARNMSPVWATASAVFAALSVAFGVNYWQHGIHANPHIVTAAFLSANLFLLTRWAAGGTNNPRWLFAFALSAGLGITHHPLTVISLPAYALFILIARPVILREWRTLLGAIGVALLGLAVWLYFPLRSPMEPAFGPSTMNTLNGFLDHVLARGLSESLPFFGAADIPTRGVVFWSIMRLQYALPVIFLAALGPIWLLVDRKWRPSGGPFPPWKLAVLYGLVFLSNYAFVMSLRAQDIMAYILGLMLIVGMLAGVGLYGLLVMTLARLRLPNAAPVLLAVALFLLGPVLQLTRNAPRISLSRYTEAYDYVNAVFGRFAGTGEGATLLNDWEHMTPIWYAQFVEGRQPDEADVTPVLVSTAQPWLESVFATLPGGPVYLSNYRREIVDAGFRLRPDGVFYQVVEPGDTSIPNELTPLTNEPGHPVEIVAYDLPQRAVAAGGYVPLTLALRAPAGTADYFVPVVHVGDLSFPFTTDSHLTTPQWQPGEIIVERFDFALPHDLPGGAYPVTVSLKNLSADVELPERYSLGELAVTAQDHPPDYSRLLANFRQRVGLVSATARLGRERRAAVWVEPLPAQPDDTIQLLLQWQSLARAEEGYTVFVHLIDADNRPLVTLDYTPLGGSAPTHLWIPKWLPGQRYLDPYRLQLPADLPPGTYYIEVGLYEMVSKRRLHMADTEGNLIGDRLILGPIAVE
ncbi:MAG TPA: DUF2723 domain-containing protein [Promineifilum sp.]|nr:DUF2723 domain-containing protein [Promineifilum sp.]HRO90341.1 DUF2723 domain-containing protein [Promineifilum sp.]HRQ14621.1 DUF2723 domain-containing protein [Promineifilum sp.]